MLLKHLALLEGKIFSLVLIELHRGQVSDDLDCSHYMKDFYANPVAIRNPKAKALLAHIE